MVYSKKKLVGHSEEKSKVIILKSEHHAHALTCELGPFGSNDIVVKWILVSSMHTLNYKMSLII